MARTLPDFSTISHHALLVEGDERTAAEVLKAVSDDVVYFRFEMLGVEECKEVRTIAHEGPRSGERLTVLMSFDRATTEAQNALLKTLEDPPATTRIVLVCPDAQSLIETVRSRLHQIDMKVRGAIDADDFLNATIAERQKLLLQAIEDKQSSTLRAIAHGLVHSTSAQSNEKRLASLSVVNTVLSELSTRSPSPKLLAEYLSIRLPKSIER